MDLLVSIISLLPAHDKVKLRYVSRRLRSVSETPSLWRELVWRYSHTGDEGCVNNVLKVYGQHVKRLSFHVTPSKLKMLEYCSNVVKLSLPTTKLDPEKLGKILLNMRHLHQLDVQWDIEIRHLLELPTLNLKELTVRIHKVTFTKIFSSTRAWVHYWISKSGCVPEKLNIVTESYSDYFIIAVWKSWIQLNCNSLAGHTGCFSLYSSLKVPLNFSPILPKFQLYFGQAVASPFVKCGGVGLLGLESRLLLLTDCISGGKEFHKAKLIQEDSLTGALAKDHLNPGVTNLKFVTEFCVSFVGLYFEHLEQLASVCRNLQRLNLYKSTNCLKCLQGLRTIANSCHNLRGLNLLGIPVSEVEDHTQLWEILSDMKLTHLAVELCVLLPSVEGGAERLTDLFQTCTNLQALESRFSHCDSCVVKFVDRSLSVLSNFSSLIHYIADFSVRLRSSNNTSLQDILTNCKQIKYLYYSFGKNMQQTFVLMPYHNLQQLCIKFESSDFPDTFMSTISAHGGLVHVVLCVRSVTSESVTVLVRNSPNLFTLYVVVYGWIYDTSGAYVQPKVLQTKLKQEFSHRQLFVTGRYIVKVVYADYEHEKCAEYLDQECQCNTDLFSLW